MRKKGDDGGGQVGEALERKEEKQEEESGSRWGWPLLGEDEDVEGGATTPFKRMTRRLQSKEPNRLSKEKI